MSPVSPSSKSEETQTRLQNQIWCQSSATRLAAKNDLIGQAPHDRSETCISCHWIVQAGLFRPSQPFPNPPKPISLQVSVIQTALQLLSSRNTAHVCLSTRNDSLTPNSYLSNYTQRYTSCATILSRVSVGKQPTARLISGRLFQYLHVGC